MREGLCGERFAEVVLCGVRLWKRFWVARGLRKRFLCGERFAEVVLCGVRLWKRFCAA